MPAGPVFLRQNWNCISTPGFGFLEPGAESEIMQHHGPTGSLTRKISSERNNESNDVYTVKINGRF